MIKYPYLQEQASSRQVIDTFKGYNRNLRIGSGEFSEMENLTSDDYPVLSVRKKRGSLGSFEYSGKGMFYVPGKGLFYTTIEEEKDYLYLRNTKGEIYYVARVDGHSKHFALMGKSLIIAPDMIWVDIENLGTGSLAEKWVVDSGVVTAQLCDAIGNVYENVTVSPDPPTAPGYHQLWLCNALGNEGLNQYEPKTAQWVSIDNTYVMLTGLGEHNFNTGDGVEITGLGNSALDGSHVLQCIGREKVVFPGIIDADVSHDCRREPITIERSVPRLDFLVECGNRLWGCSRDTNEIYACKLGDPFNWNCFQQLSTDSWVGNVGTVGPFTGAVTQQGYPVFYKQTCKHKVWPSATGAHQITTTACHGVENGAENSIAVLDGTVFYKSAFGVMADDGGGPVEIGQAIGELLYAKIWGLAFGHKYYLNLVDSKWQRHLYIYDVSKRLWHKENGVYDMAGDGCLYGSDDGVLWDLTGNTGTPEEDVSWMAVTGDLGLELPEQKYISRLTLRLSLDPGATLEVYAQYDREQTWMKLGQVYGTDLRSFSLPVRPRRCDQLKLKLQGTGMCKLYSITKTLEKGSELP